MGIWWEKTVEYRFVFDVMNEKNIFSFVAPLDGKQESDNADAIFAIAEKWVLIEFKRDNKCLESEKEKFNNYEDAKINFILKDSHHFLIYGSEHDFKFTLNCTTYFSRSESKIKDVFENGIELKKFKRYLDELKTYKKTNLNDNNSNSGSDSLANVIGITNDKQAISMTMQQFNSLCNPTISKPEPSKQYSGIKPNGF